MSKFTFDGDIEKTLRRWSVLLNNITIEDNFAGFLFRAKDIEAGEVVSVAHGLGIVPSGFWVIDAQEGAVVERSDSDDWTNKHVYLVNVGTTSSYTGRILILP